MLTAESHIYAMNLFCVAFITVAKNPEHAIAFQHKTKPQKLTKVYFYVAFKNVMKTELFVRVTVNYFMITFR